MRSDYTPNGRHKDDPTNPESYWNDWSIDRDGNKLKEEPLRNNNTASKYIEEKIREDIESVNDDFNSANLSISLAMLNIETEEDKIKALSCFCENLVKIVGKQDKIIKKLIKNRRNE